MRNNVRKAFTLVEILIVVVILGILAAIVIPQFTSASEEAQVGNVQTQLQTTRSQIELFRVRNNGQPPVLEDATNPFTDLLCGVGNTHSLADQNSVQIANSSTATQVPYMRTPPTNPRNSLNLVSNVTDPIASANAAASTHTVGWYYNETTGAFAAAGFCEVPGDDNYGKWVPETP